MVRGALLSRPAATLVVMLLAVMACGWCAAGPHDDVDVAAILVAQAQASPCSCLGERQGGQGSAPSDSGCLDSPEGALPCPPCRN